jgi:hypothetical protein
MTESLGSGFDRIREALMSPTNFDAHFSSASFPGQSSDSSELSDANNVDWTTSGPGELPESVIPGSNRANNQTSRLSSLHHDDGRSNESGPDIHRGIELDPIAPYPPTMQTENTSLEFLLHRFAPIFSAGNNFSISDDTDNENGGDLIPDCDSPTYSYQSPATDSEDEGSDPEDTRQFYLGDENFPRKRGWPAPDRSGLGMENPCHRIKSSAVTDIRDIGSTYLARPNLNSHDVLDFEQLVEVDAHFEAPMQGSSKTCDGDSVTPPANGLSSPGAES